MSLLCIITNRCRAGCGTESHSCVEWRITKRCRAVLLEEIIRQDKIKLNNIIFRWHADETGLAFSRFVLQVCAKNVCFFFVCVSSFYVYLLACSSREVNFLK